MEHENALHKENYIVYNPKQENNVEQENALYTENYIVNNQRNYNK